MKQFRALAIPADSIARAILHCLGLCLLSMPACIPNKPASPAPGPGQVMTQVSVIDALMVGRYGGVMPIPELLRDGDFGIGTLDHLDGELVVLGGHAYQVRGDGRVAEVDADRSTPFAIVTRFAQDGDFSCPGVGSLSELDDCLDDDLWQENGFLAIRVDALFASITLRSVPRQEPPYRPLVDVVKGQSVWTHQEMSGTLVGIRCPAWVGGLNVPGYHWHFLSQDRKVGGHVLDCRVREGWVRYDVCHNWLVKLDDSAEFHGVNLGADLDRDVQQVERSRREGSRQNVPGRGDDREDRGPSGAKGRP